MTEKEFNQKVEDMAARFEHRVETAADHLDKGLPVNTTKAPCFVLPQEVLLLLLKSDFCLAQNILQTKDTEQPLCGASD